MMLPFSPPAMRTPDGKLWSSMPCGPQTSVWYLETEQRGYYWGSMLAFKGTVHPKMKILSSFLLTLMYFQTCMNVFVLLNTKEDILKNEGNGAVLVNQCFFSYYGSQWCPWLQTFFKISSFSVQNKHKYRFGNTWGWVNDDRIFIFVWTVPLRDLDPLWRGSCNCAWLDLSPFYFNSVILHYCLCFLFWYP